MMMNCSVEERFFEFLLKLRVFISCRAISRTKWANLNCDAY